eukprot:UN04986
MELDNDENETNETVNDANNEIHEEPMQQPEPEPEPGPEFESEPEFEPQPEPQSQQQPEFEPEPEPEPEPQPEPQSTNADIDFETAANEPVQEEAAETPDFLTEEELQELAGSQVIGLGAGETAEFDIPGFCTDLQNHCAHGHAANLTDFQMIL